MFEDHEFALCLTHDVDRPYKTYQSIYYAMRERPRYHLKSLLPGRNPYWQFDEIVSLERDLGVRSAFYFLNEPSQFSRSARTWLRPRSWIEHAGRYDVTDERIAEIVRTLDDGGWEVGLHGSSASYRDRERLAHEKETLEDVLGRPVVGSRQHRLRLTRPETWRYQAEVGLQYDTTLGSSTEYGFQFGHGVMRPFDDEFVVFPLTLMEAALPDASTEFASAWAECERLLEEAAENDAVMTVLWHPRYFSADDFPGYRRLYRRLVERAAEMAAWIGPPRDLYDRISEPDEDACLREASDEKRLIGRQSPSDTEA